MSLFAAVDNADPSMGGAYLNSGHRYLLEIGMVKVAPSRKKPGVNNFIVEFRVHESSDPAFTRGSKASWVANMTMASTPGNIKWFVGCARGIHPTDPRLKTEINSAACEYVSSPANPLGPNAALNRPHGTMIEVTTQHETTAKGGDFTKHVWAPASTGPVLPPDPTLGQAQSQFQPQQAAAPQGAFAPGSFGAPQGQPQFQPQGQQYAPPAQQMAPQQAPWGQQQPQAAPPAQQQWGQQPAPQAAPPAQQQWGQQPAPQAAPPAQDPSRWPSQQPGVYQPAPQAAPPGFAPQGQPQYPNAQPPAYPQQAPQAAPPAQQPQQQWAPPAQPPAGPAGLPPGYQAHTDPRYAATHIWNPTTNDVRPR